MLTIPSSRKSSIAAESLLSLLWQLFRVKLERRVSLGARGQRLLQRSHLGAVEGGLLLEVSPDERQTHQSMRPTLQMLLPSKTLEI